jgi:hypothetical protein
MFQPGDQKTTVEVWEGIIKELKEAKAPPTAEPETKSITEQTIEESGEEKKVPLDAHEESPSDLAETAEQAEDEDSEERQLKDQENQEPEEEVEEYVPVEPATEEKKVVVGEAILAPEKPPVPSFVVSVEALEAVLPPLQAERSMSWGAQRFVQDVKHLIHEAKEDPQSG